MKTLKTGDLVKIKDRPFASVRYTCSSGVFVAFVGHSYTWLLTWQEWDAAEWTSGTRHTKGFWS